MRSVESSWAVVEAWLDRHHPAGRAVLEPPATDADIDTVESTLGVDLPASFCDFLRVHDGQTTDSRPLLRRYALYTTESIVGEWERMTELLESGAFDGRLGEYDDRFDGPDEEVRDVWWSDGWVPFARDASGNLLCVDLDPSPLGARGQVIAVWHDMPGRSVRAESVRAWFAGYADDIEDGRLVYSAETHSMMADREEHTRLSAERVESPTSEDIAGVFRRHEQRREETDNWFVEVCFEWQGAVGPTIQSQRGMVNLTSLVGTGRTDRAATVLREAGFDIAESGELYVTGTHPSLAPERATEVVERALAEVYDRGIEDVVEVRERTL